MWQWPHMHCTWAHRVMRWLFQGRPGTCWCSLPPSVCPPRLQWHWHVHCTHTRRGVYHHNGRLTRYNHHAARSAYHHVTMSTTAHHWYHWHVHVCTHITIPSSINRIYSPDTLCSYKTSNYHHNISKSSYCNVALLTCTHHTQASLSQTHAHPSTHILTQTQTLHTHTHTHILPHIIIYSLPSS